MEPKTHAVVTVFGSAFPREGASEYEEAREIGGMMAQAGYAICNGGYGGTMEASARGAKEAGGFTVGVVAETFGSDANRFIDRKIVVKSPVDRLLKLIELGDAYIVLRGGTGTLVELATVWEYMNKRVIQKKPVVVVGSFWTGVIKTMNDQLHREKNTRAAQLIEVAATPAECVEIVTKKMKEAKM